MPAVGLLVLLAGAFLISSALSNRNPVDTVVAIIRDPSAARDTLAASKGTGYASSTVTTSGIPGTGTGSALMTGAVSDGSAGQGAGVYKTTPATDDKSAAIIAFCRAQIGKPYRYGATGPNEWDCSALIQAAHASVGIKIPRVTALQQLGGKAVLKGSLRPGDLYFTDPGHVGLYTGNGMFIDAPRTGSKVSERKPWAFFAGRRYT